VSNTIFVPIKRLPRSIPEIQQAIYRAFERYRFPTPEVQTDPHEQQAKPVERSIITVRGVRQHDHCWISFNQYPAQVIDADLPMYMGEVTTRGNWLFAAIVVLGLFEFGETKAFNDSGELDGQPEYDATSLHKLILEAITDGKEYLAR